MESISKVFIVTSGEYSDYGITAVFLNKEDAEECCRIKTISSDSYRIEEWPLYVEKPRYYSWRCRINKISGEVISIESCEPSLENIRTIDFKGNYCTLGETKEKAVKNAQDYRTFELSKELE